MKKTQETIEKIIKNVCVIFYSLFFLSIFVCFVFCFHITDVKAEAKIAQVQKHPESNKSDTIEQHVEKYIFVSTSMPKKDLIQLAIYAKEHNADLILRGLIDGSYKKTVAVLEEIITKTGQGFSIDPELFTRYDVKMVPTFVLGTRRPKDSVFDKISGNVTPNYAFDMLMCKGEVMK